MTKADSALLAIPTPSNRDDWLKITMAYKAAGGNYETWDNWCRKADSYNELRNSTSWKSIKVAGGITEATLYYEAKENGWTPPQDEYYRPQRTETRRDQQRKAPALAITAEQTRKIRDYIAAAGEHRAEILEYCRTRGLDTATAARFNLGYDASTRRLVIPYPGADYYASRSLIIEPNGEKQPREVKYLFPPKDQAGDRPLFNIPALTSGEATVFVTEGQIDAITLEQYGGAAIASNAPNIVLKALEAAGEALTARQFLIIPDNDKDAQGNPDPEKGEKTAQKMQEALAAAGYEAYIYHLPPEYHDVNAAAVKDSAGLWEWIKQGGNLIENQRREALAEYQKTTGAERLTDLEDAIQRNATREAIKTGYPTLDNLLGDTGYPGGLYPGLYFIGAVSSLGKTTFVLQMADQIAATGQDVLIFSLEMSAVELMAKSVSRLTYFTAGSYQDKKSTLGILRGARYARYNSGELDAINKAKARYRELAKHIYITEAAGNIGAGDVRTIVKRHFEITGKRPVVFIDYLQILAPEDTKATEKQNTDRAVVELKRISRDFDIPVVAISSFNRENYKNEVSESAFKESGAIEYSSDVLIGLQFKGTGEDGFSIDAAKAEKPRKIQLKVIKNRNGRTTGKKMIDFYFYSEFNLYQDVNNGGAIPPEYAPPKSEPQPRKWV